VDLADVVWSEVREPAVLEVAPDLLLGIELRGIPGQPDRVPPGVVVEIGANDLVLMRIALVPKKKAMAGVVVAELAKEVEHLRAADVLLGIESQVEGQVATPGRHRDRTDARNLLVRASVHREARSLSPRRPGAANQRCHHEACFV
jgi:hypothetical protein